jgi:hypothetical protein
MKENNAMSKQPEILKYLFSTSDISQLAGGDVDFIEFSGINCAKLKETISEGPVFSRGEIISGVCFPRAKGRISGNFNIRQQVDGSHKLAGKGIFSLECPDQSLLTADIVMDDIYSQSSDQGHSVMVASAVLSKINYIPFKHPLLAEMAMKAAVETYFIFRSSPVEDLEELEASTDRVEGISL